MGRLQCKQIHGSCDRENSAAAGSRGAEDGDGDDRRASVDLFRPAASPSRL